MKRRDEVLVGIFTTVAVAVAIMGAIWLARGQLASGYPLYTSVPWGAGIKQGAPVQLVGVSVGFVDVVELRETGTLTVTMRINKEFRVPRGTTAAIVPNGIFGDVMVALTPKAPNPEAYAAGDTVPSTKSPASLSDVTGRADSLARTVSALLEGMKKEMVDEGGLRELRLTLANARRLSAELNDVVATQSKELQSTLASVRKATSAIDSAQVDSTVRALHSASSNAAQVISDFRATNARISAVLDKVEKGDGSAAKLLNDPGLYNDLRGALQRVDSLLADIKKNPRKYIDLRIF